MAIIRRRSGMSSAEMPHSTKQSSTVMMREDDEKVEQDDTVADAEVHVADTEDDDDADMRKNKLKTE